LKVPQNIYKSTLYFSPAQHKMNRLNSHSYMKLHWTGQTVLAIENSIWFREGRKDSHSLFWGIQKVTCYTSSPSHFNRR